ncbi:hypothetical protein [Nocardioides sp. 616]|uniref:hypothetical protein n=1 Tax=Nocardioides sp. 616 TaxID=2268090 RepID=UPI0013B43762|nr:hypothetical protein [Nocardioides sp. 616]
MWQRRRDEGVEHVFTQEDREAQLCDLEIACTRLTDLLAEHGETRAAELYRVRAQNAATLLAVGFSKSELNEVAGQFPEEPLWLDARALDYDAPRQPWQSEVAQIHAQARKIAMDLRAIATLYRA